MKHYMILISIFAFTAVVSFVNQMVYAYYFGTSTSFDMLNAVLALPLAIIGIGNGAITLIVMPILNEAKERYGNCASVLLLLIKKYTLHIALFTIAIVIIQIVLLQNRVDSTQKEQLIYLSSFVGIFLFLSFINAFFIVYFNLKKKFVLASINALSIYIISIFICFLFAKNAGVQVVVFSFILSNIILLIYFIFKFFQDYRKVDTQENPTHYKIETKVFISGIFSILPFTLPVFIDSYYLLALGSGSLSYVSYANKIIVMISSILIQPLNLILFPKILSKIASNEFIKIKAILFYLYLVTLAGVILVYLVSKLFFLDFMHIFFEKGMFTHNDSQMVYQVFLIYLVGAFGMVSMNIQNKVLTSLKLFNFQIYASIIFIFLYIGIMSTFYQSEGYLASGLSYAICWSLYTVFAGLVLYKKLAVEKQ